MTLPCKTFNVRETESVENVTTQTGRTDVEADMTLLGRSLWEAKSRQDPQQSPNKGDPYAPSGAESNDDNDDDVEDDNDDGDDDESSLRCYRGNTVTEHTLHYLKLEKSRSSSYHTSRLITLNQRLLYILDDTYYFRTLNKENACSQAISQWSRRSECDTQ